MSNAKRTTAPIGNGTVTVACIIAQKSIDEEKREKERMRKQHGEDYKYDIYPSKAKGIAAKEKNSEIPVHDVRQTTRL